MEELNERGVRNEFSNQVLERSGLGLIWDSPDRSNSDGMASLSLDAKSLPCRAHAIARACPPAACKHREMSAVALSSSAAIPDRPRHYGSFFDSHDGALKLVRSLTIAAS